MTPDQISSVKETFALVRPISDKAGMMFYDRLFEIDPKLRKMFNEDVSEQSRKLMQMIAAAVNALDKLETIVPAVQALGTRHVDYGVVDQHYDTVAEALLWTLEKGLGEAFTPKVKESWTAAYIVLADTMKAAAKTAKSRKN